MDRYIKKFFNDFDSLFNGDFDSFFNQPFNVIGETKTEKGQDTKGEWVKQTFTSKDGSYKMTTFVRTNDGKNFKREEVGTPTTIDSLKSELETCVENQEFEKAAKLRDKIKSIETNKKKIDSLKAELETAVKEQNFEKAIKLRDSLKELEK